VVVGVLWVGVGGVAVHGGGGGGGGAMTPQWRGGGGGGGSGAGWIHTIKRWDRWMHLRMTPGPSCSAPLSLQSMRCEQGYAWASIRRTHLGEAAGCIRHEEACRGAGRERTRDSVPFLFSQITSLPGITHWTLPPMSVGPAGRPTPGADRIPAANRTCPELTKLPR